MRFTNLTPHTVTLIDDQGRTRDIPPSGEVARIATVVTHVATVDGIAMVREDYGDVTGLPEPQVGHIFIVSRMVAEAMREERTDLAYPTDFSRDDEGRIVAAKALGTFAATCQACGDLRRSPQAPEGLWDDPQDPGGSGLCGDLHRWA